MSPVTLPRLSFKEPALETERVALAKEASKRLGYNRLALAIAAPDALLYTLRELRIEPFIDSKVQEYMRSKEKKSMYPGTKLVLLLLAAATALIGLFVGGMTNLNEPWSRTHYAINAMSIVGAAIVIIFACFFGFWESGNRQRIKWETFPLRDSYKGNVPEFPLRDSYKGNVPEHVLLRALEISKHSPETTFQIHQLVGVIEHRQRENPVVKFFKDPFLSVHLGNESYFIDVWDEEEFEKTI